MWRRWRSRLLGDVPAMAGAPPPPPPPEAVLQTKLVENQPYDESLDVAEPEEEVASLYAPSPPIPADLRPLRAGVGGRPRHKAARSSEEEEEEEEEEAGAPREERLKAAGLDPAPAGPTRNKVVAAQMASPRRIRETDVEDDVEDEEDDEQDSSETDSDEPEPYNPEDYECLPVSMEIKELFQYINRYVPQRIDLDHKLRPFIPDFIPAVGDNDAFLKVPRPDGKPDVLGLSVLDEPSTKQSDPTVLSLWLSENSKQHNMAIKVKSVENAEKNPKAIDNWIACITELHSCKPPASVHYARPMPDIVTLMQEWPPEFEELLGKVSLPTADISCSLAEYTDMVCATLDIPVYQSRIQSLHTLFSLYSEFKNSQHFKAPAEGKKATSPLADSALQAGETDVLSSPKQGKATGRPASTSTGSPEGLQEGGSRLED